MGEPKVWHHETCSSVARTEKACDCTVQVFTEDVLEARVRELEGRLAGIAAAVEAWEAAGMVVVAVASVRGILDEVGEAKPSTSRTAETQRPKSE